MKQSPNNHEYDRKRRIHQGLDGPPGEKLPQSQKVAKNLVNIDISVPDKPPERGVKHRGRQVPVDPQGNPHH